MTFERGQKGLARMGDEDLARQLGEIHEEFARRHTGIGMTDIPLEKEKLASKLLRLAEKQQESC